MEKSQHSPNKLEFRQWLFLYASGIAVLLGLTVLASSLGWFIGRPIMKPTAAIAAAGTLLFMLWAPRRYRKRHSWLVSLSLICLIAATFTGAFFAARRFIDLSYDGQAYHQEAIVQLYKGWNPVHEPELPPAGMAGLDKWVNHYPKATWILAANVYKWTNDIEAGKLINIVAAVMAFSFTLAALAYIKVVSRRYKLLLALLIAASPVVIYQLFSYYVDGFLMSLLVSLVALGLILQIDRKLVHLAALASIVMILINVKFTAVVYTVIALVIINLTFFFREKFEALRPLFITSVAALFVGVVIVGFNPYVTNTLRHKHPFYPLAGAHKINLKPGNVPDNFLTKPSWQILFLSSFAQSANVRGSGTYAKYKWPFQIKPDEVETFTATNPKEGGFGPLYGGALVITGFILLVGGIQLYVTHRRSRTRREALAPALEKLERRYQLTILLILAIIVSCAINPISSYARYVPQMWLIPIIAIMLVFVFKRSKLLRLSAFFLALALLLNIVLIARVNLKEQIRATAQVKQQFGRLAQISQTTPVVLDLGQFGSSTRIKLAEFGVHYREKGKDETCKRPLRIAIYSIVTRCRN